MVYYMPGNFQPLNFEGPSPNEEHRIQWARLGSRLNLR